MRATWLPHVFAVWPSSPASRSLLARADRLRLRLPASSWRTTPPTAWRATRPTARRVTPPTARRVTSVAQHAADAHPAERKADPRCDAVPDQSRTPRPRRASAARQRATRRAAQTHTESMAFGNYFEHVGPRGQTPLTRMRDAGYISSRVGYEVGENIAWGTLELATPRAIVAAWMASPPHRANILDARYRETGIGVSPHPPPPWPMARPAPSTRRTSASSPAADTHVSDFGRARSLGRERSRRAGSLHVPSRCCWGPPSPRDA